MTQRTRPTPIAVVGIGCVLPDARSPEAFWQRTLEGHCAIRELGGATWDWNRYFDPHEEAVDRSYSRLGAQIRDYEFDWRRFKVPPVEAEQINPMQLMVLDAGTQALDAVKVIPRATSGLFLGATGLGWQRATGLRVHMRRMLEQVEEATRLLRSLAGSAGLLELGGHLRRERELVPDEEDLRLAGNAAGMDEDLDLLFMHAARGGAVVGRIDLEDAGHADGRRGLGDTLALQARFELRVGGARGIFLLDRRRPKLDLGEMHALPMRQLQGAATEHQCRHVSGSHDAGRHGRRQARLEAGLLQQENLLRQVEGIDLLKVYGRAAAPCPRASVLFFLPLKVGTFENSR